MFAPDVRLVKSRPTGRGESATSVRRVHPSDHLETLEREATAFADALRRGHAALPVAGCPGWTLADLGRHVGGVHRWARAALGTQPTQGPPHGEGSSPRDDAEVLSWFLDGAAALIATLRGTDPEHPRWTMAAPTTARFWFRRQAHETSLHWWDAQSCQGAAAPIAADLALDGPDEAIAMFLPRQVGLGRLVVAPEVVHLVAGDARFVLTSDPDHQDDPPLAVVTGAPDSTLPLLWGHIGLDDARVRLDVGLDATRDLLRTPLTP